MFSTPSIHKVMTRLLQNARAGRLFAACFLFAALVVSGCEFSAVDDGADASLGNLVAAVSTSDSPDKAEKDIQRLFNKTGLGVDYKPGLTKATYTGYKLEDVLLEHLAAEQTAFNKGDRTRGKTVGFIFNNLVEAQKEGALVAANTMFGRGFPLINATEAEAVESFKYAVSNALQQPDLQESALLLSVVSEGSKLAAQEADYTFTSDKLLSPVQAYLFGVWLSEHGPALPLVGDGEVELGKDAAVSCPNWCQQKGYVMFAQFKTQIVNKQFKGYVFDTGSIEGVSGKDIVKLGASSNLTKGTWESLYPIKYVVVENYSWKYKTVHMDGRLTGGFDNTNITGTDKNIAYVQFCGLKPTNCQMEAYKIYFAEICAGVKVDKAKAKLLTNLQACHWQGKIKCSMSQCN